MTERISLNGSWKLYYYTDEMQDVADPGLLNQETCIPAIVPGNVELDLAAAGIIPEDLFRAMATEENRYLEEYTWWYEKKFAIPETTAEKRIYLCFDGVDCLAGYYLNGKKIGSSENAFRQIRLEITDYILPAEENVLHVHLLPAVSYAYRQEFPQFLQTRGGEQSHLRKPVHAFGWDIFPRAVTAGLWKDVNLEIDDGYGFEDFSYYCTKATADEALIRFQGSVYAPFRDFRKNISVRVTGCCGESHFSHTERIFFKTTTFQVSVPYPQLWWPYGYGPANVYDLTYELIVDGTVRATNRMNLGIRSVELQRTETLLEEGHCFRFLINGVEIMCKGSNWVPMDAYHSRDRVRYQQALELFTDTHCNILRIWGGGVYEQEEFYDYCDRHGIMVWQDFMMACVIVSMDERMVENIRQEATWAVRTLRSHPSIILWSGDNEIDAMVASMGKRPGINKITRDLLPQVIDLNDTGRPYLPSSPYLSDSAYLQYHKEDIFPELHQWGSRDYYKADFYKHSRAHFVSETGYHGCPCLESVKKIVDTDKIWPIFNEQWVLHSSDQAGNMYRVQLMWDQIRQLFHFEPDNIDDFILASQISQAEAKKYFIERIRIGRPYTSGIIWWNMLDGWPQMSDAVVDYFFEKKLAYHYIKRSQNPFALMIDEMRDWAYTLVAANDTLETVTGNYQVMDIDTDEVLAQGSYTVAPNGNQTLCKIPMMYPEKRFLLIQWDNGDGPQYNHYLCGMPAFDFRQYKSWLSKMDAAIG